MIEQTIVRGDEAGRRGRLGDPLYVGGDPVFDGSPWPTEAAERSPYPDF